MTRLPRSKPGSALPLPDPGGWFMSPGLGPHLWTDCGQEADPSEPQSPHPGNGLTPPPLTRAASGLVCPPVNWGASVSCRAAVSMVATTSLAPWALSVTLVVPDLLGRWRFCASQRSAPLFLPALPHPRPLTHTHTHTHTHTQS